MSEENQEMVKHKGTKKNYRSSPKYEKLKYLFALNKQLIFHIEVQKFKLSDI
jgi:hypothetical protein